MFYMETNKRFCKHFKCASPHYYNYNDTFLEKNLLTEAKHTLLLSHFSSYNIMVFEIDISKRMLLNSYSLLYFLN
jgi:hypothetical protein